MFAVKGWNVDAGNLKRQTEVFRASTASDQNGEKKSRKRKREDAKTDNSQDVGQLWKQHVEGIKPTKPDINAKKEKKRPKLDGEAAVGQGKLGIDKSVKANGGGVRAKAAAQEKSNSQSIKPAKEKRTRKQKQEIQKQKDSKITTTAKPTESTKREVKKNAPPTMPPLPAKAKLTPMQAAMRQKLISARFRHLNQTLYTEPSAKSVELFDQNPEMFEDYHSGFRQQVAIWPENPVDNVIVTITSRGKVRLTSQKQAFKGKKRQSQVPNVVEQRDGTVPALPRTHGTCIIADLGCGDARLAQTLKDSGDGQNLQLKVLSYDLHSPSPLVTKADISKLPAADGSVDVAIFCLALMGTNWITFIEEAYRVLHWKGELWVAEIKSRFGRVGRAGKPVEHSVGGKRKQAAIKKAQDAKKREQEDVNEQDTLAVEVDGAETANNTETDVSAFIEVLSRRGFVLKNGESSIDLSNKMFVKMEFLKAATPTKGKHKPDETAKPTDKFKKSKAKFLDEDNKNDIATEDEGKVLKPCLYKVR